MAWSLRGVSADSSAIRPETMSLAETAFSKKTSKGTTSCDGSWTYLCSRARLTVLSCRSRCCASRVRVRGRRNVALAGLQEPLLQLQDRLGDALDGAAALLQVLQEQVRPLDIGDDVLLVVGHRAAGAARRRAVGPEARRTGGGTAG